MEPLFGSDLMGYILGASTLTKGCVDVFRGFFPRRQWIPPLMAIILGVFFVLLFLLYGGHVLDEQTVSGAVLGGVFAALSAVGITSLHDWRHQKEAPHTPLVVVEGEGGGNE